MRRTAHRSRPRNRTRPTKPRQGPDFTAPASKPPEPHPRRGLKLLFVVSGILPLLGLGGRPPELMLPIFLNMVRLVGLAFLGSLAVGAMAKLFGGLPPKRSIIEHPFW